MAHNNKKIVKPTALALLNQSDHELVYKTGIVNTIRHAIMGTKSSHLKAPSFTDLLTLLKI